MSQLLLSIVIPTYTRSDMLILTLESLRLQSYLPLDKVEIILSNDCSKDNTIQVVEEYQQSHPHLPITLINQEQNLGGPGNWKFCQTAAQGKYIYLLSDDDTLHPDFLQEYLPVLENDPSIDLIFSGITFCDKNMAPLSDKVLSPHLGVHHALDALYQQLDAHHMVMSTIYKREIFLQSGGWDPQYGVHIDCSAFCHHALLSQKAYYINKPLFNYRILPDSWASFDIDKQHIQYQNYRRKIDHLAEKAKKNNIPLKEDFNGYYQKHAQSLFNSLEIKFANHNISGKDLRTILERIVDIYPEGRATTQFKKLNLSSWIGLWWLKLIRKVLRKNNPYQSHYSLFEECK